MEIIILLVLATVTGVAGEAYGAACAAATLLIVAALVLLVLRLTSARRTLGVRHGP